MPLFFLLEHKLILDLHGLFRRLILLFQGRSGLKRLLPGEKFQVRVRHIDVNCSLRLVKITFVFGVVERILCYQIVKEDVFCLIL